MRTLLGTGREFRWVPTPSEDASGHQNLIQLIQLRWIALVGQILTIAFVRYALGIELGLEAMGLVIAGQLAVNVLSTVRVHALESVDVGNTELLAGLLFDVAALTALLYLSGGVTNPFIFLYPLQVTLGAVLLEGWAQWAIVAITVLCFAGLTQWYVPLALPDGDVAELFRLHTSGLFICFVLDATLLAVFVRRINRNFRVRDARLAALRQRAAEEDHVVRMGLLASGAAHELGTPMATLAVILGDWERMERFRDDPELLEELREMQGEVRRCKDIVAGILRSAGEARGEAPMFTTTRRFVADTAQEWRATRPVAHFELRLRIEDPRPIISDATLKQVICNVLDNALEASPDWVALSANQRDGTLFLTISDCGPGFSADVLERLGRPYNSTKGRPGGGLGMFLVFNVMRKLGGTVCADNRPSGGAEVRMAIPLAALSVPDDDHD